MMIIRHYQILQANFLSKKKYQFLEMLNFLVERCRGDRINLKNEISKIEAFILNKKNICK